MYLSILIYTYDVFDLRHFWQDKVRRNITYYLGNITGYTDTITTPDSAAPNYTDITTELTMSNMTYDLDGNLELMSYSKQIIETASDGYYKVTNITRNYTTYDGNGSIIGYQELATTNLNNVTHTYTYSDITYDLYGNTIKAVTVTKPRNHGILTECDEDFLSISIRFP